jgi:hypothetical protein
MSGRSLNGAVSAVSTMLGAMALTRTPKRPTSDAKPFTSRPIAALVEPYTASPGSMVTART